MTGQQEDDLDELEKKRLAALDEALNERSSSFRMREGSIADCRRKLTRNRRKKGVG